MNRKEYIRTIKQLAASYAEETIQIRRYLHRNPELSFQEQETAGYIAGLLKNYGIEYRTGVAGNGIVAEIRGGIPGKRVIALRADMDALPIEEKNDVSYRSVYPGRMHACGHDLHLASLIGTAKILQEMKNDLAGTVRLIFQPAEEKIPGGAKQMIEEGVLSNPTPDVVIGQHVMPELEAGTAGFRSGIYMASSDEVYITVKGKGGHAAMPDRLIDPVPVACQIILALQQIASRYAPPLVPTVLSFGRLIADGARNAIPDEVSIEGTFRTMDESWREKAHRRIEEIVISIAKSMGADCEFTILKGYPVLVNDEDVTSRTKSAAYEYLGKQNVKELEMRMTAEDFAYFAKACPATLYRLGTAGKEDRFTAPLHSSNFDVDESSIETGMGLMAWIALEFLFKV